MTDSREGTSAEGSGVPLRRVALSVAALYLLVVLALQSSYGPTWDTPMGELPFGERLFSYLTSGEEGFLDFSAFTPEPFVRAPHPNFSVARFELSQVYPFAGLLSAASCRLLWTELAWMPAMQAHHLVIPLFVALLLYVLVCWVGRRASLLAGVATALFLAFSPRFFAHSFNNLKDIPEACLYTFAILAGYRAFRTGRARWWTLAGALTAFGLAQKANALFLPVQLGLTFAIAAALPSLRAARTFRWSWKGVAFGAATFVAAYFAVSPQLWTDPLPKLNEHFGTILRAGSTTFTALPEPTAASQQLVPKNLEGALYVLWTTPPVLLLLALVGLFSKRLTAVVRLFLALAVLIPIGRTMLPGMRNFDGVRHFIEFFPPLCALAGVGLVAAADGIGPRLSGSRALPRLVLGSLALLAVVFPTVRDHPNSLCYFNGLAGGLQGVRSRGNEEAADYWANSYWQGLAWLNQNAPTGAGLYVPIAKQVAQASAPVVLRDDIRFPSTDADELYVMVLYRPSMYGPFLRRLEREHAPEHEVRVDGVPILRIHRLGTGPDRAAWMELLTRERVARRLEQRLYDWLLEHPAEWKRVLELLADGRAHTPDQTTALIQAELPESFHAAVPEIVWLRSAD